MSEATGGQLHCPSMAAYDLNVVEQGLAAAGGYVRTAMSEVAQDLGGEELAERIAAMADSGGVLPNPDALMALEAIQAGAAERVIVMSRAIQQATHERELAEQRKLNVQKSGRAVLRALAGLNPFRPSARRRV